MSTLYWCIRISDSFLSSLCLACINRSFSQQFLYDEAEAEANLSFEQLVFTIAEHIYIHYKNHAAYVLFDKDFKIGLKEINKVLNFIWA